MASTTTNSSFIYKLKLNSDKKEEYIKSLVNIMPDIETITQSLSTNLNKKQVDDTIIQITKLIKGVADPLFGKTFKTNADHNTPTPPYYTDECEYKRKIFLDALNVFRRDSSDTNRQTMVNARSGFKNLARKCRREHDANQTEKLRRAKLDNANDYWKLLKGKAEPQKIHSISDTEFYDYFVKISNPVMENINIVADDFIDNVPLYEAGELDTLYDELNTFITVDEVTKAITQLKCGKSAGLDLLINEFYIYGCEILASPLCSFFNSILKLGYSPAEWSMGLIIPLHKKGDVNCIENYRGKTLLSTFEKLFTGILNNRLSFWADAYGVYIEAQAGFRANHSTVDHIFNLHGVMSHLLNHSKKLYCAFLDFRKAFDYIDRNFLWHKLIGLGIRCRIFDVIQSMYSVVKSRVQVGAKKTQRIWMFIGSAARRMSVAFSFAMFLNDIENTLKTNKCEGINMGLTRMLLLLYADDAVILSDSRHNLQQGLTILNEYCTKWKITLNTDKTKIVVFWKGGKLSVKDKWYYDGKELEVMKHFIYLGAVFSSGGSFLENL